MAAWLSQRSTILSTFSATAINYSTLSGSAITLNSTMISLGTSTNSVYTRLSQGNFNSSVSTSSWVSSLTGRVSTTTVAMSANAQYQLALSQSSISTSVMFTSTLGTSWSTLSGATGLPNPNETSYTTGAISGNGQYGVLGTSAGQLLVTSTFGQTFSGLTTTSPYVYLPFEGTTADQSGLSRTVTATGTFTYGTGTVGLYSAFFNNTSGNNTASFNIAVPWPGAPNFTITGWFNATSFSSGGVTPTIFATYSNSIRAIISNAGVLTVTVPSNGSTATLATSGTLITNRWYNYTFTFQTNGLCSFYLFYLDNALVGSSITNVGGTGTNALTPIYLGSNGSALNPFIGYMDDIDIYTIAMPFTTLAASVTPVPTIYLPLDTVPVSGTTGGTTLTVPIAPNNPTSATSYVVGSGAVNLNNPTAGGTATKYIRGTWTVPTSFTVNLWFNTQATNQYQMIFSALSGGVEIFIGNTNALVAYIPQGTTGIYSVATTATLSTNTWYNTTLIYQANGTSSFYLNNILVGNFTQSTGLTGWTQSTQFSLGTYDHNETYAFVGYIDDFKIYYTAIPFATLFPTLVSAPFIYLPLDTVPVIGSTTSGVLPTTLTVVGTPAPAPSFVMGSGAVRLTNIINSTPSQYIQGPLTFMPNYTITLWFNTQSIATGGYQIIYAMYSSALQIYLNGTNQLGIVAGNGIAGGTFISPFTNALTINTWYNVTVSYQTGGNYYFYLNNSLISSGPIGPSVAYTSNKFSIGIYDNWISGTSYPFNGFIDDVKIYNTAIPFTPMYPSQSFTSTAVSSSGQYMLATMANQGLYMSSNFGGTFSPVTGALLNAVWSNAQVSATGQYMLVNAAPQIVQPQLTGLTGDITTATVVQTTWVQNGISWTSNASNTILAAGYQPWVAFNNVGNTSVVPYSWASLTNYPTPTSITNISSPGPGNYTGEWLQIYSNVPLVMHSYNFACGGLNLNFPKEYFIVGSRDNSSWFPIQSVTLSSNPFTANFVIATSPAIIVNSSASQTINGGAAVSFTPTIYATTANPYNYFRIIAKTNFGGGNFELNEWYINFQTGGQIYSTNYGSTWNNGNTLTTSNISQISSGLYIVAPQLTGLTGLTNSTNPIYSVWQQNGATWISYASTVFNSTFQPWIAFNNTVPTSNAGGSYSWASAASYSAGIFGTPTVTTTTTIQSPAAQDYYGEWLQIQSSTAFVLYSYNFGANYGAPANTPKTYFIVGSNNTNGPWYPIQQASINTNPFTNASTGGIPTSPPILINQSGTQTMSSAAASGTVTCTTYSTSVNAYTVFRIIANTLFLGTSFELDEWYVNFTSVSPTLIAQLTFDGTFANTIGGNILTSPANGGNGTAVTLSTTQVKVGTQSLFVPNTVGAATPLSFQSYSLTSSTFFNYNSPTSNSYSISVWVFPTAIPATGQSSTLFALTNGGSAISLQVYINPTRSLTFFYYTTNNPGSAMTTSSLDNAITANAWNHVVIMFASSTTFLYINGTNVASTVYSGTPCLQGSGTDSPAALIIGCTNYFSGNGSSGYAGYIDDFRIYNAPMTSPQVQAIYNNSANSLILNTPNTISAYGSSISNPYILTPSSSLALSESGQYAITSYITAVPTLLAQLNFENNYVDTATPPGLTTGTVQGFSTSGGNITTPGTIYKVGTNALFSTNTAGNTTSLTYVNFPISTPITMASFSMTAWIRPSTIPTATLATPFALNNGSSTAGPYIAINTTGELQCVYYTTTNGSSATSITSTSTLVINTWYHVGVVIANRMVYLYLNGNIEASAAYSGTLSLASGAAPTNVYVGCATSTSVNSTTGTNGYAGYVDDLRIYNGALTQQQMLTLYGNNFGVTTLIPLSSAFYTSPLQSGLTSNSWNQGGVSWTATASISNTPAQGPFNAFSGSYPVAWVGALGAYRNGSPFDYTAGTYSTAITGITPSPTGGDWLQIQSSVPLIMTSYTFASSGILQQPQKYYIVGSNDGQTWYPIQLANGTVNPLTTANTACSSYLLVSTSTTPTAQTIQGNATGSYTTTGYAGSLNTYTYFRIVVTNTWGYTNGNTNIGQWFINFTGATNTSLYNIVSPLTGLSTNIYTSGTIPGVITNSAISNTGQYMVVITNNTSGNNVYYSMNYGSTFTGLQLGTQVLTSCAISYDGSYITIVSGETVYTLNNNSTGFSVALGNQAGYQNQANNAIAIGNYAGYQNQTANSIILNASGPGALGTGLNAVTQGFYVAPIASYTASSSQVFTLLGYGSDSQITQGIGSISTTLGNVYIGQNVGILNTTGYQNVIIGQAAGGSITTGYNTTLIGNYAGPVLTTSYNNTFIGTAAGRDTTTGSLNTFLGVLAGAGNITGGNNICIGTAAYCSSVSSVNEIVIGTNITGSGSNTVKIGCGTNVVGTTITFFNNVTYTSMPTYSNVTLQASNATYNMGYISFLKSDLGGAYMNIGLANTNNVQQAYLMLLPTNATASILQPAEDNVMSLGGSSRRFVSVFAVNGAIQTSDSNEKNLTILPYGLNELLQMRTIMYKWKSQDSLPDTDPTKHYKYYGLCADQLAAILPELVYDDDPTTPIQMNYSEIIPICVKAIQEQHAEITTLKQQIVDMASQLATLTQRLVNAGIA